MSALGQKRTSHLIWTSSALPPKADKQGEARLVRFVPKADICSAANCSLFDDLVGSDEQAGRHGQAERLRRLEVKDGFVLGWRLHRKVGGLSAA